MVSLELTPYNLLNNYSIIILIILVDRKKPFKRIAIAVLNNLWKKLDGGNGYFEWG